MFLHIVQCFNRVGRLSAAYIPADRSGSVPAVHLVRAYNLLVVSVLLATTL